MALGDLLLPVLIAVSAVFYGIFAGRAQAGRMRDLRDDVVTGNSRGLLVIMVVVALVLVSAVA